MNVIHPDEYAKLKRGDFDNQYRKVIVFKEATPNILLEPVYFANSTFPEIQFMEPFNHVYNTIELRNTEKVKKSAFAGLMKNINPLEGVPKDYLDYVVHFSLSSIPTDSNVDTMLGWKKAKKLHVYDDGDMVQEFFNRIDELSMLKDLSDLQLDVRDFTYLEVNATTFIENLPSLKQLVFKGFALTEDECKEFLANNQVPSNWRGGLYGPFRTIGYEKIEA